MKNYPKTYEDVFTSERSLKKCNILNVTTDIGLDAGQYKRAIKKQFMEMQNNFFNDLVKMVWLTRRFCYRGVNRDKNRLNGNVMDAAYGVFMRHHVGIESRMISCNWYSSKIASYFDELFPDFDLLDPFRDEMPYPFKHVSLEFLMVVHKMPERMELLKEAELRLMGYTKFLDYIINYINCYNEDVNEPRYIFSFTHSKQPYVKVNDIK